MNELVRRKDISFPIFTEMNRRFLTFDFVFQHPCYFRPSKDLQCGLVFLH